MARRGYSELYDAIQSAFESPEDMSVDRLATWMVRGESGKGFSEKTIKIAENLSKSKEISESIEITKDFRILEGLKARAKDLDVHKDTVVRSAEVRIDEVRKEELIRKKKTTTIYRDELKRAENEAEIDNILSEALGELGVGKNYDSLVEASEILKGRFE